MLNSSPSCQTPSSNNLIIVGAGGHAREVAWVAGEAKVKWHLIGFLDDKSLSQEQTNFGVRVLGGVADWPKHSHASFVIAIGSPRVRRDVLKRMLELGTPRFATIVHRSVIHAPEVRIGEGSMVMAGCVLSTNIQVGCHAILNQSITAGHDSNIEDFCTLAPRVTLSGNVKIRQGGELGTAVCVRQGLTIGRGAMVGMGSVVIRDVGDNELVLGVPARFTRKLDPF